MNIAIIGSGKIGLDLYHKSLRVPYIKNIFLFNRNNRSIGYKYAKKNKFNISHKGINGLIKIINHIDVILDATSASSNIENFKKIKKYLTKNIFFLNLTPSGIGEIFVPYQNNKKVPQCINLISCGGQSTIPLIDLISKKLKNNLKYVELVSSISSISAGPATRSNVNEYMSMTQSAIKKLCKIPDAKVILNLNPSDPPVNMMNTIFFELKSNLKKTDIKNIRNSISIINKKIKSYIPEYNAKYFNTFDKNIFRITVRVVGQGDYLPKFSGNLDIINSSSIQILKLIHEKKKL